MTDVAAPRVSVIMPAYNSGPYIDAAISSVREQTFEDWELIVVDDCSTDDTRERVRAHIDVDARVSIIELPANMGAPAGPRNRGVARARGAYVALLDADDIWHRQKLETQMAVVDRTGTRFCSAGLVDFTDGTQPQFTPVVGQPPLQTISFWRTLINTKTPTSTIVADRQLFLDFPFNEDPGYKAREDLDCFLHMHERLGSTVKVLHPLLGYRITGSQQISGSKATMVKRHYRVLREYRFESGRRMGPVAALFTGTHFASAAYHRAWRGTM